jgi:hypothetical protein
MREEIEMWRPTLSSAVAGDRWMAQKALRVLTEHIALNYLVEVTMRDCRSRGERYLLDIVPAIKWATPMRNNELTVNDFKEE